MVERVLPQSSQNLFRQYVQEVDSLVQNSQTERVQIAQRPLETIGRSTSTQIVFCIEQPVNILGCAKHSFTDDTQPGRCYSGSKTVNHSVERKKV